MPRGLAVTRLLDREPLFAQTPDHEIGDLLLVFDHQDAHDGDSSLANRNRRSSLQVDPLIDSRLAPARRERTDPMFGNRDQQWKRGRGQANSKKLGPVVIVAAELKRQMRRR